MMSSSDIIADLMKQAKKVIATLDRIAVKLADQGLDNQRTSPLLSPQKADGKTAKPTVSRLPTDSRCNYDAKESHFTSLLSENETTLSAHQLFDINPDPNSSLYVVAGVENDLGICHCHYKNDNIESIVGISCDIPSETNDDTNISDAHKVLDEMPLPDFIREMAETTNIEEETVAHQVFDELPTSKMDSIPLPLSDFQLDFALTSPTWKHLFGKVPNEISHNIVLSKKFVLKSHDELPKLNKFNVGQDWRESLETTSWLPFQYYGIIRHYLETIPKPDNSDYSEKKILYFRRLGLDCFEVALLHVFVHVLYDKLVFPIKSNQWSTWAQMIYCNRLGGRSTYKYFDPGICVWLFHTLTLEDKGDLSTEEMVMVQLSYELCYSGKTDRRHPWIESDVKGKKIVQFSCGMIIWSKHAILVFERVKHMMETIANYLHAHMAGEILVEVCEFEFVDVIDETRCVTQFFVLKLGWNRNVKCKGLYTREKSVIGLSCREKLPYPYLDNYFLPSAIRQKLLVGVEHDKRYVISMVKLNFRYLSLGTMVATCLPLAQMHHALEIFTITICESLICDMDGLASCLFIYDHGDYKNEMMGSYKYFDPGIEVFKQELCYNLILADTCVFRGEDFERSTQKLSNVVVLWSDFMYNQQSISSLPNFIFDPGGERIKMVPENPDGIFTCECQVRMEAQIKVFDPGLMLMDVDALRPTYVGNHCVASYDLGGIGHDNNLTLLVRNLSGYARELIFNCDTIPMHYFDWFAVPYASFPQHKVSKCEHAVIDNCCESLPSGAWLYSLVFYSNAIVVNFNIATKAIAHDYDNHWDVTFVFDPGGQFTRLVLGAMVTNPQVGMCYVLVELSLVFDP